MKYLDASARVVGEYRYWLIRRWSALPSELMVTWCMLNPSTADATEDDATVRKIVGFSKRWGYGAALIVNLAAARATNPRELREIDEAVGYENPNWVHRALVGPTIAAWGDGVRHIDRAWTLQLVEDEARRGVVHCLGTTKSGNPRHPVRLGYDTMRQRWRP